MGKKLFISPNTQEQSSIFGKLELNLSAGDLPEGRIEMDVSSLSFAAITVQCVNSSATGTIEVKQGNIAGNLFSLVSPVILTLSANTSQGAFDIPVSGSIIGIDISKVTWGSQGRVIITMNAKENGGANPYISSSSGGATSSTSLLEATGTLEIHDNITTGGVVLPNTCIYVKVENIGSGVAFINGSVGQISLQPGESFYEEMQLLDKVYRQAQVDYNPNGATTLRITKKLRT